MWLKNISTLVEGARRAVGNFDPRTFGYSNFTKFFNGVPRLRENFELKHTGKSMQMRRRRGVNANLAASSSAGATPRPITNSKNQDDKVTKLAVQKITKVLLANTLAGKRTRLSEMANALEPVLAELGIKKSKKQTLSAILRKCETVATKAEIDFPYTLQLVGSTIFMVREPGDAV